MMKKQMIFVAFVGFYGMSCLGVQEQNAQNKGAKAFLINLNGLSSVVEKYDRANIPHTNKINGRYFGDWIKYFDPMRTENISVVNQLEDGTFTQARALDSFNRRELEKCYHEVYPFRTFEQTSRTPYAIYKGNTERSAYEPEHLDLIEQLQSDKCVLCMCGGGKQVIVSHAQGLPYTVCKAFELKRSADIEQEFKKNISRSWKKAEQDRKQREAVAK